MELIDKDTLVAWIERLKADALQKKEQCKRSGLEKIVHQIGVYNNILSFLNTIEVKGADLTKEIEKCLKQYHMLAVGRKDFTDIAKHFYELGLQAQKGE